MLRLIFERTRTAVPEKNFTEDCIENGRSVSRAALITSTDGDGPGIRKRECRIVTSGATDGAVNRESLIEIERLPEGDLLRRQRIVPGNSSPPERLTDAERYLNPYFRAAAPRLKGMDRRQHCQHNEQNIERESRAPKEFRHAGVTSPWSNGGRNTC